MNPRPTIVRARRPAPAWTARVVLATVIGLAATACQSADGAGSSPDATVTPTTLTPIVTLPQQTSVPAPTTVATTTTVPATTTTVAETTVPETTTTVPETTTTVPETTTTVPDVPPLDPPLQAIGTADGDEARRVQQRLLELGFWLSGVDGDYGATTKQAVMAFQKWSGLARTGKLDQVTADFLTSTTERVQAKATSGSLVEVDKDKQILMIVRDGITIWAINVSTGSGQYFLEENQKKPGTFESGRSVTPSGDFKVNRERPEGWWEGDLGKIYRPKYFNGGIAIHGSGNIPGQPASHGCVRVSVPAMDMIWATDLVPKGTPVVVYGNDVEPTGPRPTAPPAPPPTAAPDTTAPPVVDTTTAPPPATTPAPAVETTAAPPTSASLP